MAITSNVNMNTGNNSGNTAKQGTAQRRTGFMAGGMFGAPIGRGIGSEYLNKISENLGTIYKTANPEFQLDVLVFDKGNEISLAYSAIAVCIRTKTSNITAVHVMIVEATGEKLNPIFDNINNVQVEIMRVTGDAFDGELVKIVNERVSKAFPNTTVVIVDGCVIPEEFDPSNPVHMHLLARNAALAGGTEVDARDPNFRDLNITEDGRGTSLIIDIGFNRHQIDDAVGLPMRSDVLVQFRSQKPGQNQNQSVNSNDRDMSISEISGFLDLLYAPMQAQQNPWAQPVPGMTQKFASRLVITNLATNIGYTPGMVLLALASSLTLNNDGNWIQSFRPSATTGKDIDMYDVGALNIEGNLENNQTGYGVPPDTKGREFGSDDLGRFISSLVRPGLMISIDVPDCGPQTWYTSVFRDAANGSQAAIDVIYRAAMELTNGNFAKHFAAGTPMFDDLYNRVHLGYWTDKTGQRRDIRDIDYLAVANIIGRNSPEYLRDWSDTFLRVQYPLPMRLAGRKKMIETLTNMTAVFKGFASRVTFSAPFLTALGRGCTDAGLVPQVKTPYSSLDFNSQRGVAGFVNTALMAPGQNFGMTGFGTYNPQMYNQGNLYHRY